MTAKTGPKAAKSVDPLVLPNSRKQSKRFDTFCRYYVPIRDDRRGRTTRPLRLRPFQVEFFARIFDGAQQPRLAAFLVGRGNAKTTTSAAICLFHLFAGSFNENVCLVATDERQAFLAFEICRFMVLNSPDLERRANVFKDKIVCPGTQSTLRVLPASPDSLEGLDFSLCLLDEAGVASAETFEVLNDSQGKRPSSTLLLLGTPGTDPDSPLARVRKHCKEHPDDPLTVLVEHSADDFQSHPAECRHCWQLANPLLGHGLAEDGLVNALQVSTEARFRRVRLAQWALGTGDSYIDRATWDSNKDDQRVILPGSPVVVAIDGSRTNDATVVTVTSIEPKPIVQIAGFWAPREDGSEVPILDVEQIIRDQADIYDVREVTGDPFGWSRTFAVLESEGLTVTQFPNTRERMTPALEAFRTAVIEHELSHDGDERLAQHVANAVIVEWARGYIVAKRTKSSPRKIDALISAVMGFTRAKWHAQQRPKSKTLKVVKMRR